VRPRLLTLLAGVLALGLLAGACSDDSGSSSQAEPEPEEHLPPNDFDALAEMFDPQLEELGLRLTRGALVDTSEGYEVSDTGRHLALYVEPTGEYAAADYADNIVTTARLFLPLVFERWDRLETFDVCQEPRPGEDDREEPPPVTQLFVSRPDSADVDWANVTLPELVDATTPTSSTFRLYVHPMLRSDPAYVEAAGQAS
jgi:hypothetical protein